LLDSRKPGKADIPDKAPTFYYITDRSQLSGVSLDACIRRAIAWGVDFIQIREKDLPDRALYDLTCETVALAHKTKCKVLVNGRADIALAAGADGVHLPSAGLRASKIRSCFSSQLIIGTSVHSIREARSPHCSGTDYLILGHLFPTQSKSALGAPLGLNYLKKFCSSVSEPVFGLGGIRAELVKSVLDSGAAGVAGISLFQNDEEFKRLRELFDPKVDAASRRVSS
jgi:thiamine-phosphate pyrophosphorylase